MDSFGQTVNGSSSNSLFLKMLAKVFIAYNENFAECERKEVAACMQFTSLHNNTLYGVLAVTLTLSCDQAA